MSRLLRQCADAERVLSEAYSLMAERFKAEPEVYELFCKMARDEEEHAAKIDFAVRLETAEGTVLDTTGIDKGKVEELFLKSQKVLSAAKGDLEASMAADLAMTMEGEFMQLHLETAASVKDSQLKSLFSALSRGDDEHIATLKNILSALSHY